MRATDATGVRPPADPPQRRRDRRGPALPARLRWLPGVAVAFVVAYVAQQAHAAVPLVNASLLCIVLGVMAGNLVRMPAVLTPGIAVAARRVLRIGIVLLGLQLSLREIAALGPGILLVVLAVVGGGIAGTLLIGRALGVPFAQRLLIASGFSICGAAAIAAVEGVIERDEEDVAASIALVVAFGTLMIPAMPLLAGVLGLDVHTAALLAGASVHEVAQVVAAGSLLGPAAVGPAVVVKLARVALLAPVVVVVAAVTRRTAAAVRTGHPASGESAATTTRPPLVPLFLVGFLACSVATTVLSPGPALLGAAGTAQGLCLSAAMFALGVSVRVATLRRFGPRPALLGLLSTLLVLAIALTGVLTVA